MEHVNLLARPDAGRHAERVARLNRTSTGITARGPGSPASGPGSRPRGRHACDPPGAAAAPPRFGCRASPPIREESSTLPAQHGRSALASLPARDASRSRRRKSFAPVHASAASVSASTATPPRSARSPTRSVAPAMPRAGESRAPCSHAPPLDLPPDLLLPRDPAFLPRPRAQRARERIVLGPRPFAHSHCSAHPLQHTIRLRRQRLLGQRSVDLLRLPAGERHTLRHHPVAAVRTAHVDVEPRSPLRLLPRHQHPDLREAPLLVLPQLP